MRHALAAALALAACDVDSDFAPSPSTVGDAARGRQIFETVGCGACHEAPGVPNARGVVGPPLGGVASRSIIAGGIANTPGAMIRWIDDPQALRPGSAMPDVGLDADEARDVAAFLYTLE